MSHEMLVQRSVKGDVNGQRARVFSPSRPSRLLAQTRDGSRKAQMKRDVE